MPSERDRPLAEWVVLGLLAERPQHGFALSRLLARGGDVGRVWSASRPLTYRAIDQLAEAGLIAPVRVESGQGPQRTVHEITAAGRAELRAWLRTPVAHIRDVRAVLLAKLLLLERAGRSPRRLLDAQAKVFAPLLADALAAPADGVVERWRREQAEAVVRFLDGAATAARRG
jgi:PadR family transcriptional regulator AphA